MATNCHPAISTAISTFAVYNTKSTTFLSITDTWALGAYNSGTHTSPNWVASYKKAETAAIVARKAELDKISDPSSTI